METPEQIEGYNNWVAYRAKALTDPLGAQELLDSYTNVKIPVFMENNIHGDEEEGADSMMQIIRDLVDAAPRDQPDGRQLPRPRDPHHDPER